ncbi:MAG: hypothetical protein OHK0023_21920 [Anaerolineae bacterium]
MNGSPEVPRSPQASIPSAIAPTRRSRGAGVSPWVLLFFVVISFALTLGFGIYLIAAKSVILVINGVRYDVRTHQQNVAGFIREAGIFLDSADRLNVSLDTPLYNQIVIQLDKARQILLEADGVSRRIYTHLTDVQAILLEANVIVGLYDQVVVDGLPLEDVPNRQPRHIRVMRARTITLQDGAQSITRQSVAQTVAEVLAEAKLPLYVADQISPPLGAPLADDQRIVIRRSVPVVIAVDGRTVISRSAAETVGECLLESGVILIGLDYTIPDETAPLTPDLTIQVVRVTEEDQVEREEIAYEQVYQPDTTIPPQTTRLIQSGINGLLERRIRVRREDGIIVSRSQPEIVIVRDPQNEIIGIGATPALVTPEPIPTQS